MNISILVTPAVEGGRPSDDSSVPPKKGEPIKLEESEHAAAEVRIFSPMSDCTSSSNAPCGSAIPPKRGATTPSRLFVPPKHALDPQEYQHAKKRLKKAIVEHYRCVVTMSLFGCSAEIELVTWLAMLLQRGHCIHYHDADIRLVLLLGVSRS
jgi:hypothetical protein